MSFRYAKVLAAIVATIIWLFGCAISNTKGDNLDNKQKLRVNETNDEEDAASFLESLVDIELRTRDIYMCNLPVTVEIEISNKKDIRGIGIESEIVLIKGEKEYQVKSGNAFGTYWVILDRAFGPLDFGKHEITALIKLVFTSAKHLNNEKSKAVTIEVTRKADFMIGSRLPFDELVMIGENEILESTLNRSLKVCRSKIPFMLPDNAIDFQITCGGEVSVDRAYEIWFSIGDGKTQYKTNLAITIPKGTKDFRSAVMGLNYPKGIVKPGDELKIYLIPSWFVAYKDSRIKSFLAGTVEAGILKVPPPLPEHGNASTDGSE